MRYVDAFCDMRCQQRFEDANSSVLNSLDAETMTMLVATWHEHGVCPNCGAPRPRACSASPIAYARTHRAA